MKAAQQQLGPSALAK
jgi:hypothetical protein